MSLTKKGRRKIHVEGCNYLWAVRDNGDHYSLVVQGHDEGQLLYVCVSHWDCARTFGDPVTPALVKRVILESLVKGWVPTATGMQPFKLSIDDGYFQNKDEA